MTWRLVTRCIWLNTLVDRIVSEPLEPAGAVAEPDALRAVERTAGLRMPFEHPAIVVTDDLSRYERLKLHILNLSHSWLGGALAAGWRARGTHGVCGARRPRHARRTRAAAGGGGRPGLFGARARGGGARLCRHHARPIDQPLPGASRLADIHTNHAMKIEKRVGGFVRWVEEGGKATPSLPALRAMAVRQAVVA
ncbi:hypothetical protein AB5I41_27590 [Sphingomonas sp. MMS24-JH45]